MIIDLLLIYFKQIIYNKMIEYWKKYIENFD